MMPSSTITMGWLDVRSDNDEGGTMPNKLCKLGVVAVYRTRAMDGIKQLMGYCCFCAKSDEMVIS